MVYILFTSRKSLSCPAPNIGILRGPHRWRNSQRARLECGRSCIRNPVGSNQRICTLIFVASLLSTQHYGERADWSARNQNNVSEWSDMSTCGLLFQWTNFWQQNRAHKLIVYWGVMVFNATSSNISVISWRSVLLVEKTTNLLQVSGKRYHIHVSILFPL